VVKEFNLCHCNPRPRPSPSPNPRANNTINTITTAMIMQQQTSGGHEQSGSEI
jgi:hypothetical protein